MNPRKRAAEILSDINSAYYFTDEPFTFTSNTKSPVYIDCRKIISFPDKRSEIINQFIRIIKENIGLDGIDVIAGGESAGIPYAAFLANELKKPMIYIRKKAKDFGRLSQVEGVLNDGDQVILVEDLTFNSGSKINFCKGIEAAGGKIKDILTVFEYGIPEARIMLKESGYTLHSLVSWDDLLPLLEEREYFSPDQCNEVRNFLTNPSKWIVKRSV